MHREQPPPKPPAEYDLTPTRAGYYEDLRPRYRPRLTWALTATLVGVYLLQSLVPGFEGRYALISAAVRQGQWYRLVTGAFLHGGELHLAANAYFGWFIGGRIERSIGTWRLLVITVVAMLGSGLAVVALGQNAVGFSGVLYGWLASWLAFHLTPRFPSLKLAGAQLRAYLQTLGANVLISLIPGISFAAHLGGFVSGFAVAYLLGLEPKRGAGR